MELLLVIGNIFFTNPGAEGKVRFFAVRGLPFREPNEEELPAFSNPSGAEGYYGWIGYPPYEGIYWVLQQRLNEETEIRDVVHCGNGHLVALCGGAGNVYKSLDWGKTWSYISTIPRVGNGEFRMDFEPNEIAGDRIVYGVKENVGGYTIYYYISYDYGKTWEQTGAVGVGNAGITCNAIKYLGEGHWCSAGRSNTDRPLYSVDDGVTWITGTSVVVDPEGPIFNGGNGLVFYWDRYNSRWLKSVDWGKSYVSASTPPVFFRCGYILDNLYIMGGSDGHIYKSTTGWQTDAFVDCGALAGVTQVKTILRLTIDVFIAGGTNSSYLYVSADQGDTWIDYGRMGEVNDILKLMSLSSSELLAAVNNGRFFKPQE